MSVFGQLRDQYGFVVEATPMDELRTIEPIRLVGATFVGNVIDPNYWVKTESNSGTVQQSSGQVSLSCANSGNGYSALNSVRNGRYVGGSANRFRTQVRFGDTGTSNNVRRWGMFNASDGCFFQLSNSTVQAVTRKGASDTVVNSASFSNSSISLDTNVHSYELYFTNSKVYFVSDGNLRHVVNASTATWTTSTTLPIRYENYNIEGSSSSTVMEVRVGTIYRMGKLETDAQYSRATTAGNQILKYGPGRLHRVAVGDMVSATSLYIFDSTASTGTLLSVITPGAKAVQPFTMEYGVPFQNGLVITTSGTWDATVVYE